MTTATQVWRAQPDPPRLYRAFGCPVLSAMYIVMAICIDVVLLLCKPQYTWPGLIIVLIGIPVYLFWSQSAGARARQLQGALD